MPDYEIYTKQTIERAYAYTLELPVNMGDSTERITDRMMKVQADNSSLELDIGLNSHLEEIGKQDEGEETISCIMRNGVQIWPRPRKKTDYDKAGKKAAQSVIDQLNQLETPDDIDPDYENAVADLRE